MADNDTSTDDTEYEDPEDSVCTEFKVRDGFVDEEAEPVFVWSFKCTRCGKQTPCKGDPTGFGGRPYSCSHCGWVSLLEQDAIESFADEHSVDTDTERSDHP